MSDLLKRNVANILLILLIMIALGFVSYIIEFVQTDFLVSINNISQNNFDFIIKFVLLLGLQYILLPIFQLIIAKFRQRITLNTRKQQYKLFINEIYLKKHVDLYESKEMNEINYVYKNIDSPSKAMFSFLLVIQEIVLLSFYLFILSSVNLVIFFSSFSMLLFISTIRYFYAAKELNNQIDSVPEERKAEYYRSILFDKNMIKEVKSYNSSDFFIKLSQDNFDKSSNKRFQLRIKNAQLYDFIKTCSIIIQIGFIIILFIGNNHLLTLYELFLLISVFVKSLKHIEELTDNLPDFYKNLINSRKIFKFAKSKETNDKISIDNLEGIELKNVDFKYPNSKENTLNDICLKINTQNSISIIGENGAGKSTIVKIILGLLTPTSGQVLINNIPIDEINLESYYKTIGVAFQEIVKIDMSLYENIIIGNIDMKTPTERFNRIIDLLNIRSFSNKLTNGEHTILGKTIYNGEEISLGEWQRIIIARALMNDAYYILDEPTASVDPIEEGKLFDSINLLLTKSKGILISHRIGFSKMSNTILVMKNGKIIESGMHEELIRFNSLYKQMYEKQKETYDW